MLILSNSLIKSSSTIIWWYTIQLVKRTTPNNGNEGLADFINSGAVAGQGQFVNDPVSDQALNQLMEYARQNGPTVVKAHCHMTEHLDQMIREGQIIATFTHRDPRDVILSAIDCHDREVKSGGQMRFPMFSSFEASVAAMSRHCIKADPWIAHPQVHKFRYTDTVSDSRQQIQNLARTLKVEVTDELVDDIMRVESEQKSNNTNWMEFNQAKLTRYPSEMSQAQIEVCNRELGPWIEKFGYSTEEPCSNPAVPIDSSAA